MKLLVGLLVAGCCFAQNAPQLTHDDLIKFTDRTANGRFWRDLTDPLAKQGLILGIWTAAFSLVPRADALKYKPSNLETKEVATAIDRFYEEPENLQITLMDALRVITLKTNGADPDTIARALAEIRRRLSQPPKPELTPKAN